MKTIVVCTNLRPFTTQPSCAQRGSKELADWLEQEIESRGLDACVDRSVCLGYCLFGPNVRLLGGEFHREATKEKLTNMLDRLEQDE